MNPTVIVWTILLSLLAVVGIGVIGFMPLPKPLRHQRPCWAHVFGMSAIGVIAIGSRYWEVVAQTAPPGLGLLAGPVAFVVGYLVFNCCSSSDAGVGGGGSSRYTLDFVVCSGASALWGRVAEIVRRLIEADDREALQKFASHLDAMAELMDDLEESSAPNVVEEVARIAKACRKIEACILHFTRQWPERAGVVASEDPLFSQMKAVMDEGIFNPRADGIQLRRSMNRLRELRSQLRGLAEVIRARFGGDSPSAGMVLAH